MLKFCEGGSFFAKRTITVCRGSFSLRVRIRSGRRPDSFYGSAIDGRLVCGLQMRDFVCFPQSVVYVGIGPTIC